MRILASIALAWLMCAAVLFAQQAWVFRAAEAAVKSTPHLSRWSLPQSWSRRLRRRTASWRPRSRQLTSWRVGACPAAAVVVVPIPASVTVTILPQHPHNPHVSAVTGIAEELKEAQAALAARGEELAGATAELEATRSKLADATAAMQDAHEQLSELQVGVREGRDGQGKGR